MRAGVRPGAVPLATVVQPFRLERAPLAFFQYDCNLRTRIYWVASRLPLNLPNPFRVTQPNSHCGQRSLDARCDVACWRRRTSS